jgi:hypothetical protein
MWLVASNRPTRSAVLNSGVAEVVRLAHSAEQLSFQVLLEPARTHLFQAQRLPDLPSTSLV